jgi:hypothetical protein
MFHLAEAKKKCFFELGEESQFRRTFKIKVVDLKKVIYYSEFVNAGERMKMETGKNI